MAYYLKDLPFTEEGKKLKLSDEDRERFRLVYKREGDGWVLHDIYEKGGEYGDDCIVVPLESTYIGNESFRIGQEFANVQGSTGDPKPIGVKSWIGLWERMYKKEFGTIPPRTCYTDGQKYTYQDGIEYRDNLHMYPIGRTDVVGGHVVRGKKSRTVNEGSIVFIVPICHAHNNNDNCYMKTSRKTFVVKLRYKTNPRDYLAQHPLETHEKI